MHVFLFDFYRSFGDAPLPEYTIANHETTYEIFPAGSQKGNPKLIDSLGFSYTVKKGSRKIGNTWRCSKRNCPARVIEVNDTFTQGPREHIHACDLGAAVNAKLKSRIKARAKTDLFTPAGTLVHEEMVYIVRHGRDQDMTHPDLLKRMANRARAAPPQ